MMTPKNESCAIEPDDEKSNRALLNLAEEIGRILGKELAKRPSHEGPAKQGGDVSEEQPTDRP